MSRHLEEWERDALAEMEAEMASDHFLVGVCAYVEFVSYSNGKGKKKRRWPRQVQLLIYRRRAYVLPKDRMTGELEWIMKSIFPEDRIPREFGNDWYGAFLHALRTMPKVKRGQTRKGSKISYRFA